MNIKDIMADQTMDILDNPAWYGSIGVHEPFTFGTALARRFPPEILFGAALAEHSEAAYADLAQIVNEGEVIALFGADLPADVPGWTILQRMTVMQMICDQPVPEPQNADQVIELTPADVPDMLHLIELTKPGPFAPRTIELGRYIGLRENGQLIAMAGERMYPPGYREISAVCTHPDYQSRGHARLLVSLLVNDNWQRGNIPFLHVIPGNASAIHLYESLNFHQRREMHILVISR